MGIQSNRILEFSKPHPVQTKTSCSFDCVVSLSLASVYDGSGNWGFLAYVGVPYVFGSVQSRSAIIQNLRKAISVFEMPNECFKRTFATLAAIASYLKTASGDSQKGCSGAGGPSDFDEFLVKINNFITYLPKSLNCLKVL